MKMKIVISFGVDDHNDDEPMQAVVEVAEVDRYRMMVNMMMLMGMLIDSLNFTPLYALLVVLE